MPLKYLEYLAAKVSFDTLPPNWNTFDLGRFAPGKALWDYQQQALKYALAVLFKYYEEFEDYSPGHDAGADVVRKEKLTEWYRQGMVMSERERQSLNLSLHGGKRGLRSLVDSFYPLDEENPRIDFQQICNRMGFWMATGSGKTLVLVKLLEFLHLLMRRAEIPAHDVLMLAHREDLVGQFQRTVAEYNRAPDAPMHIELRELREYSEAKREAPGGLLGADSTLRVFYYRSDNLSDERKERIVDFRNYDNDGKWYVLLDEAHKGGAEDSKRKHIYTILTRAGFLFNFSATFIDPIDLVTTVSNFNLAEFIGKGYGKHIVVLRQELSAFKKRGAADYTDDEKRKVVVKSMLLLVYTARKVKALRDASGDPLLYHRPMLMALVNSMNPEDADLKLYFQQVLAIGRGEVSAKVWKEAKAELWEELKEEPPFLFEQNGKVNIAKEEVEAVTPREVWREIYNAESEHGGEIEVLVRPGNRKEIAFKMKTSDRPFALIKMGRDVTQWLRVHLTGFDYVETLETESFFRGLNDEDSPINVLMGSRAFYEGWDSNRPNVINFVNIGVGEDAKKFILQSVGRGVRVQSWKGERRRFEELYESFDDKALFRSLRDSTPAPETLYVLGTNQEALRIVLEELKKEKPIPANFLKLELNPDAPERLLLVPEYRDHGAPLIDEKAPSKFEVAAEDFGLLENYGKAVDDRILLLGHNATPKKSKSFRHSLKHSDTYYLKQGSRNYKNLEVMVARVLTYFGLRSKELERIRALEKRDIVHFRQIAVDQDRLEEIQRRVGRVLFSQTPEGIKQKEEIEERYRQGEFDFEEAIRIIEEKELSRCQTYNDELAIEYLANHYNLPAIYSKKVHLDYIKHIIDTDSEVRFLNALRDYVKKSESVLRQLDWWMFSKLDQYLDTPFIPYYDPRQNRIARFIPDFLFRGRKDDKYLILFVDPKGMENQDWERKAEGIKRLYEDNGALKVFEAENVKVKVRLFYFTRDRNPAAEGDYKRFWMDDPASLFKTALGL